jgi:hypothetical protein
MSSISNVTTIVSIEATCLLCNAPDSASVPAARLAFYRRHRHNDVKVQDVFPVNEFDDNTRSIIIASTKQPELGISAHICVECEE